MFYNVISIIIILVIFCLGLYVLFSNYRSKINIIFFFIAFSSLEWLLANFVIDFNKNLDYALLLARLALLGPLLIAPLYYLFSLIFSLNKELKAKSVFLIFLPTLVFLCFVPTKYNVESVWVDTWGINFQPGIVYPLFFIYLIIYLLLSCINFFQGFKRSTGPKRMQNLFILIGFVSAFLIGLLTNLLLPILGYNRLIIYGPSVSIIFLLLFTFISIMKHKLFDLKVLAVQVFSFILAVVIFSEIFIAKSVEELLVKIFLFVVVLFFSYLLIRSVVQEVKLRVTIETLNKELSSKNEYLDELLKQKSEFLHVTSHQLKTPISIIRGYLSMIIDGDYKGTKKDEAIIKVMQATNRLSDTVRDFLDASDLEGETIYFKLEPVNIHDILKETISDKQILIKNKNLQIITAEPHEEIPLVSTSKDRIIDVFSNLIDNAVYYTPKGSITISFIKKGKSVIVEIKDTGIGISKEESAKLFEKFSRSSRSKLLRPDGSGLGLFIARKIVINCGGKIWFHSDGQGTGTSFFVELPIYNDKKI